MKLLRPKLGIGSKTLIAFTAVFWVPVIALITILYISFNKQMINEGLDSIRTNLKGAHVVYEERAKNLQSVLEQITGMTEVQELFYTEDNAKLQKILLQFGKKNTHAEILIAVDENQKVLSRKNGTSGDIIILGDALSRALMTGETTVSTELVTREFLALEDESLSNKIRDLGVGQFVITPVRYGDKITGAIVAGILLTGESWLGNNVHHRFGVDMALFAGETIESLYLHSTASLPHTTWIAGQPIPEGLRETISLGRPFSGILGIDGVKHITAFEPVLDSRNRVIGAIGVSRQSKNITALVTRTIGKVLAFVAAGAFVLSLLITVIIYLDITRPLDFLIKAMRNFEHGNPDSTVALKTGDEFEKLGECFNVMAKSVRTREERLRKNYQVAKHLMSTIDLEELSDKILNVVIDVTGSQLGILYLCNYEKNSLIPVNSYGCTSDLASINFEAGYPGRALMNGECITISLEEAETAVEIELGFMQFKPDHIAYIPLVYNESRLGVLVIGQGSKFDAEDIEQFNYLGNQISIALDNTIVHRKIQELSVSDPLTGLYNRRYLTGRLEEEWARCIRKNEPLSIIMADLDDFKTVNDSLGHDKGDEVLKVVADILLKLSRKEDIVARYGGEEFVIIFANMNSADASVKAEQIRTAVKNSTYPWSGKGITMSIGIASYPEIRVRTAEELLHYADKAMYKAKSCGKNRVLINNA